MKILLISPLDPAKPDAAKVKWLTGGENSFSRRLLEYPPKGVDYTHFQEALATGQIKWGKWYPLFRVLVQLRIVPLCVGILDIQLVGKFDVVHMHVFSARLTGEVSPIIVSDSSDNDETLRNYFAWPEWRIGWTNWIRDRMFNIFGIVGPSNSSGLIVFSEYAKRLHGGVGRVIYPGVEDLAQNKETHKGVRLVFVGTWFERKGGRMVVETYRKLRQKFPGLKLTVVGEVPSGIPTDDFEHFLWLPREKLMKKVFARGDILVHLPHHEGFGLVVVEAMMWGMPVVVTKVGALPELVINNETGLVVEPGNGIELETALEKLITQKLLRRKMGIKARARYKKYFSQKVINKQWESSYKECAADGWK